MLFRSYGRNKDQSRPCKITPNYYTHIPGSCLIEMGNTRVLCSATIDKKLPRWLQDGDHGWVHAEYSLLPNSTSERVSRERDKVGGRTMEIQRLIARSLRSAVDLHAIKGLSLMVDCDVLLADGGTRTASITGGFVAMALAIQHAQKTGTLPANRRPIRNFLAGISLGKVNSDLMLDLDYQEDSNCAVDMNLVMLGKEQIVEIQGTGEKGFFNGEELQKMLALGLNGIAQLQEAQQAALGSLMDFKTLFNFSH